ncbi:hypothetical protein D3C81_1279580 [compost metagenome]
MERYPVFAHRDLPHVVADCYYSGAWYVAWDFHWLGAGEFEVSANYVWAAHRCGQKHPANHSVYFGQQFFRNGRIPCVATCDWRCCAKHIHGGSDFRVGQSGLAFC